MIRVARIFFNDTATTEIYTLSLHDALPIWRNFALLCDPVSRDSRARRRAIPRVRREPWLGSGFLRGYDSSGRDRKSTRLNSSHANRSYAVFCSKKDK